MTNNNIKLPKGEILWISHYTQNRERLAYIVTSKALDRSIYFLYEVCDGKLTKISKNKNPNEFYKIIRCEEGSENE